MNVILLRRELEIMSQLDHPNLVKLFEIYEDEQYVHLVMEYCSGGDVAERIIDNGNFSEKEAGNIMQKLLCALEYLHSNNISHRDLKAENFLYDSLEENSEIKIADFGMSVKFGTNTRMKSLAGTPYYLAPEVIKGSYTKMCDVWSLGVFLYFILSGSHPFRGFEITEIFDKISDGTVKFNGKPWNTISELAKDLINKMLTVDPKKRITISKALLHPWINQYKNANTQPVPAHIFDSLKQYKAQSKLWQEALKVSVRSLSSPEIAELKKWFQIIDKNNSGTITASELDEAMKLSGYSIAESELKTIIDNFSYLNKGVINYSDFLVATMDKKKLIDEEVIWQAFKFFDVDNDGVISNKDFINALNKSGSVVPQNLPENNEILTKQYENINFEKFKQIVQEDEKNSEKNSEKNIEENSEKNSEISVGEHFTRVFRRLSVEYSR